MKNKVPAYKLLQTYNLGCVRIYTSPFFISELLGFCFCIFVIFKCFGSNDFNISERKQNQIKSAAFKIMISFIKGKTMSELTLCQKVTRTTGCASLGILHIHIHTISLWSKHSNTDSLSYSWICESRSLTWSSQAHTLTVSTAASSNCWSDFDLMRGSLVCKSPRIKISIWKWIIR